MEECIVEASIDVGINCYQLMEECIDGA